MSRVGEDIARQTVRNHIYSPTAPPPLWWKIVTSTLFHTTKGCRRRIDFNCGIDTYHDTGRRLNSLILLSHTVRCCLTMSAFNSVLLPWTFTAPLAMTIYFSARRAAKWSPCSTNRIANRRDFLKPMITSSI